MSTTVNTIKMLLWALFGMFALTYLLSLNIENHFMDINSKWVSNSFLFTIAGGIFASLIVVLLCEFVRYRQMKYTTEITLITYLASLYSQFLIIQSNCKRALASQDAIADNLIQSTCDNATMTIDSINGIDYTPFCNNKTKAVITKFKAENQRTIKEILTSFFFYRIAYSEDKMILMKRGKREIITSNCPNVNNALHKIVNQTSTVLSYLDTIITDLDNELGKKYVWQNRKQAVNSYQKNYTSQNLDDYLKEDIVVF